MSIIKNPNELVTAGAFAGLIYGEPGTGKSTLTLSSVNPVMLDADNGMKRVKPRWRKASLPMTSYQQVLDLLAGTELDAFDTIVPDTLGKFVEFIGDWCCEQDPKNRKRGGGLSQAGYGAIKVEFARVVREFKKRGKNLLFVAHAKAEKDGEITKMRPDCPGSSGNDLIKELDFMGYVEMHGDRRTISFTPSERFYAKNSLELDAVIEIADPEKTGQNNFIQKFIVEKSAARVLEENAENEKYDALVKPLLEKVATVTDAAGANAMLDILNKAVVIWDSQRVTKNALNEKIKSLGLTYDKDAKAFKVAATTQTQDTVKGPSEQSLAESAQKTDSTPTAQPENKVAVALTEQHKETLTKALMEGVAQCKTIAALDAYLKEQEADQSALLAAGASEHIKKFIAAADARRVALQSKPAEKAA